MTRIACHELAPRIGDLSGNGAATIAAVIDAVAAGAEIVVLPELATSGYVFASKAEAARLAIARTDPLFDRWAEAAGGAVVIGGFCERGDDGALFSSAAVVDAGGVRAVYRKTHLWDREKLVFTAGSEPPPVLDLAHGRIGVCVCYDLEFPELTRRLSLEGAELIAVPTNWPLVPRPAGERPPEVVIAMATARVNRVVVAACDRAGTERGVEWTAGTTIIGDEGWPLASSAAGPLVLADVDLGRTRTKTLTPLADLHADRRPELYRPVLDPPDRTPPLPTPRTRP